MTMTPEVLAPRVTTEPGAVHLPQPRPPPPSQGRLTGNTFRYASRADWDKMARDHRPIYTAPSEQAATERLGEFNENWGAKYPAITRLWENTWTSV